MKYNLVKFFVLALVMVSSSMVANVIAEETSVESVDAAKIYVNNTDAGNKLSTKPFDYRGFTKQYFEAWNQSQKPDATKEDLESYLALLTDDVGYQHLPWSTDDSRQPDGKAGLRKGMTYYLASHDEYTSTLTNQAYGHNVIMIEYETFAKGTHPDNGQVQQYQKTVFEVLEIENGKVSVIRHYAN